MCIDIISTKDGLIIAIDLTLNCPTAKGRGLLYKIFYLIGDCQSKRQIYKRCLMSLLKCNCAMMSSSLK
jgi:hypothetical protein